MNAIVVDFYVRCWRCQRRSKTGPYRAHGTEKYWFEWTLFGLMYRSPYGTARILVMQCAVCH